MDILSHGLWSVAAGQAIDLKIRRRLAWWKFFIWGCLPDAVAFGIPFIWTVYQMISGGIAWGEFRPPHENGEATRLDRYPVYALATLLYGPGHSLIIFALILPIVWLVKNGWRRLTFASFPWPMLGWGIHVIMDVPTHSYRFYPTPVFWPVSDWKFDGFSWGQLWFMVLDVLMLVAVFVVIRMVRRKQAPKITALSPDMKRASVPAKAALVKKALIATAIVLAAVLVLVFRYFVLVRPATPVPAVIYPAPRGGISTDTPVAGDLSLSEQPVLPAEPAEFQSPPPVVVYPKNAIGLQRIEFNPPIGDIGRIYFNRVNRILLMAVTEADGLRSIWRLDNELGTSRVLAVNDREGEIFLGGDSLGRVYAGFADPGELYRSEDQGLTWTKVIDSMDGTFWAIADDSRGTVWGAQHAWNSAILYRSTDEGVTWEPWKDLQALYPDQAKTYRAGDDRFALRHLHGVAYFGGKLFVGTGDVFRATLMSEDGGENWRQVWSEGFTAWTPLDDHSGILLGPDRLQSHGIARLDLASGKTTEVWNPIPYQYSGYTYSLMAMEGVYYAAFHVETNEVASFAGRSGVIISPDGVTWYPFLEFDPLTHWARTDIFLAPGDRWSGHITLNGALYRFEPPLGRWFEVHRAFGQ